MVLSAGHHLKGQYLLGRQAAMIYGQQERRWTAEDCYNYVSRNYLLWGLRYGYCTVQVGSSHYMDRFEKQNLQLKG